MDVHTIALLMQDNTIEAVDVVQGDSEMILHLSDGISVELVIDSIHINIQDLDD